MYYFDVSNEMTDLRSQLVFSEVGLPSHCPLHRAP